MNHRDGDIGRAVGAGKPRNPSGKGGRRQTYLSPIKSWSGGLTAEETAVWEMVANAIREKGVRPSHAANAAGMGRAWKDHRRRRTPLYYYLCQCWSQACADMIGQIREAESWQAKAWILERSDPMEFAVDGSIRRTIVSWAQESGLDVADLSDLIRVLKKCRDAEIDLWDLVEAEIKLRGTCPQLL